LELFPGFAHLQPPATWDAEVTIHLIAGARAALTAAGTDTTAIVLAPGETTGLQFMPPEARAMPPGFVPLIEVVASPAGGAPMRRWGRLD
jgi:hypothetical protein